MKPTEISINYTVKKEQLLALIQSNIIITKLLISLNKIGLDPSNYYSNLSVTILKIMNIKLNEEQFDEYEDLYDNAMNIDIHNKKHLQKLAETIHSHLLKFKNCQT